NLVWEATNNSDAEEPDGRTARRIVQLMEEKRDKPFFLGCGFHKPHLPFVAPKKYFDLYPPERIELPRTPANDRDDIPPIALTHQAGDDAMSELERKTAVAAYHAATSFMDAQAGFVLGALDRMNLWDNTIVLLFGDHGWHLNDHLGLWRKMTVFEEAARAPLLVAAPGHKKGISTKRLVEWVDLYPSLCDLAGLAKPEGLEGTSFVPLLDNPSRAWKKAVFTIVARGSDPGQASGGARGKEGILGRSVRTERYRYTEWGSSDMSELYDHSNDPKEFTNLARTPKHAITVEQMRKVLRDGWKAALPG
ncbi:MAG: sulfatase-like hydrolase/transferase, partial [Acidobacteriia bacterium]|nr:sulfatase-like hydrolase/transferase [Terriglobia bacterium]